MERWKLASLRWTSSRSPTRSNASSAAAGCPRAVGAVRKRPERPQPARGARRPADHRTRRARTADPARHDDPHQPAREAGLAVREPDPTDGRAVRVTITPAGAARVLEHRDARAALIRARLAQLSDDDQAALVAALPALRSFATHPAPAHRND
ncbi:MAG: hypothetical protein WDM88_01760 [Galbitalea sp.]